MSRPLLGGQGLSGWRLLHNILQYTALLYNYSAVFCTGLVPIALYCNASNVLQMSCTLWRLLHNILRCCTCTLTSLHLFCFAVFAPIAPYCNALCIKYLANFLHSQCLAQDCTAVLLSKTFQPVVQTTFSNGCCPIQAM